MKWGDLIIQLCLLVSFILLLFTESNFLKWSAIIIGLFGILSFLSSKDLNFFLIPFAIILFYSVLMTIKTDASLYVFLTLFSSLGFVLTAVKPFREFKQKMDLELPELPVEVYNFYDDSDEKRVKTVRKTVQGSKTAKLPKNKASSSSKKSASKNAKTLKKAKKSESKSRVSKVKSSKPKSSKAKSSKSQNFGTKNKNAKK